MRKCSIIKQLQITKGSRCDYEQLCRYHYRQVQLGPYAAIFSLKGSGRLAAALNNTPAAVIVYSFPTPANELRNIALGDYFSGLDRATKLSLINRDIRTISRVIVEPRFRGLGLAVKIVRETMPKINVPIIEAMAVMGLVNPFFEKAGMTAYKAPLAARCVQMLEAFLLVGIREKELFDSVKVQRKIDKLGKSKAAFIEKQMRLFLQSYGKRRLMCDGLERTGYILNKLTARPVYYIWFNEKS